MYFIVVVVLKITIEGLPDDLVEKFIELRIPKGIHLKDARVLDEALGSLIIWTNMSTGALKTKDVFFTAIEKILKEIFSKSPADHADKDRTVDVTIDVSIENDDYENNEEDIFRCGVCFKEFCVLEAFRRHKLNCCRQQTTISVSDHCEVVGYNIDEFPILCQHQQNLNTCNITDEMKDEIQTYLRQCPCALFYSGNVKTKRKLYCKRHIRSAERMLLSPNLNTALRKMMPNVCLCVLRGEYGYLTSIDRKCLKKIRQEMPDQWIDRTLFVVTATSFSGSLRNLHTLSHEIGRELGINMNTITYRIFKDKDEDIFKRMSFYFEKQLAEKIDDVSRQLYSLSDNVTLALQYAVSPSFTKRLGQILLAGPLGVRLHDSVTNASRSYQWKGESFTRSKLTVREATDKIARFVCEELGRDIVETIIQHLTVEISGKQDVSSALLKYIDLKDMGSSFIKDIFAILLSVLFGAVGWIISAVIILFTGTYIDSTSFRDEVAGKIQSQIHKNKDHIIQEVLAKFNSDAIPKFEALHASLSIYDMEFHRIFSEREYLIKKDKIEHEFRTIAGKNELIRNFKFEHERLSIYVSGDEKNQEAVKEFVDTYFRPDVNTQVVMDLNSEEI